ncbi:purine-nucleoside phosphorylase [Paracoccaceae bacterium]|jgi:purine-nucleoside phosphorylase|nr:purine-nucleoside phosphorylase [Marinovum sp.]MDB3931036.1 purine-nucleoside phosphorylase [Paracoccaceae bacterium]MDC0900179.1 purine-nucleoside phosphorylase [Paracoccaceae bacterium]PDH60014.1 MAG: purine-nucleoside phosphorylase [Rhodobacteraceae bacterium MED-G07]|tara:strand:+ start:6791 stop:7501 length:711 start_codon:yes stop_codon:yes gene_type:complete
MTIHIGATIDEIADTVLLPGDPMRAKWAAEQFLTSPRLVNQVRGMFGYTGTFNGNRVTIQGSGMGMPSLSIYANELIRDYNAQTLIRIGSCGGMQPNIDIRDIILAQTTTYVTTPSSTVMKEISFSPCADFELIKNAHSFAESKGFKTHVGNIYSSDTFYDERADLNEQMVRHGVLAVEMEAAELYTLAARFNRKALAILTVSDHLQTGEALPSDEREKTFAQMVEVALAAAFPTK